MAPQVCLIHRHFVTRQSKSCAYTVLDLAMHVLNNVTNHANACRGYRYGSGFA